MLDIDQSENCNEDYLEIRENDPFGNILGMPLHKINIFLEYFRTFLSYFFFILGVFCGSSIPSLLPPTEKLWIKFSSDDNGVGKGFRAEYNYGAAIIILKGKLKKK